MTDAIVLCSRRWNSFRVKRPLAGSTKQRQVIRHIRYQHALRKVEDLVKVDECPRFWSLRIQYVQNTLISFFEINLLAICRCISSGLLEEFSVSKHTQIAKSQGPAEI